MTGIASSLSTMLARMRERSWRTRNRKHPTAGKSAAPGTTQLRRTAYPCTDRTTVSRWFLPDTVVLARVSIPSH